MRKWQFDPNSNGGGFLSLQDALGWRIIAQLIPAPAGHCIDTGHLIAQLLNEHETRGEAGSNHAA